MVFNQQPHNTSDDGANRSASLSNSPSGEDPAPFRFNPAAPEFNPASLGLSPTAPQFNPTALGSTRTSFDSSHASLGSHRASLDSNRASLHSNRASLHSHRASLGFSHIAPQFNPSAYGSNRTSFDSSRASLGSHRASLNSNTTSLDSNRVSLGFTPMAPQSNHTAYGSNRAPLGSNRPSLDANRASLGSHRASRRLGPMAPLSTPTAYGSNRAPLDSNRASLHSSTTSLQINPPDNLSPYANKYSGSKWKPTFHRLVPDGRSLKAVPVKFPGSGQVGFFANGQGVAEPSLQAYQNRNTDPAQGQGSSQYPYFDTSTIMYNSNGEALYRPDHHTHFPLKAPGDYRKMGPRIPSRNPHLYLRGNGSYPLGGAHVSPPASTHVELEGAEWIMGNTHPFVDPLNGGMPTRGERQLPVHVKMAAVLRWLGTSDQFKFEKRMEDPQTPPRRSGPEHHSDDSSSGGSWFPWT
ncbi:hypothetical protein DM02DRAFT_621348 [Periconia macrospinosa]|uniref:Uncharacterized protein n=1 Tax=Periconia macrospinosa TaxID=97972 RepID=A0A2V1EE83_9PLEO|nr:hypothetical protein DM02DRAFT_621348 [Periconia macrospinosa]